MARLGFGYFITVYWFLVGFIRFAWTVMELADDIYDDYEIYIPILWIFIETAVITGAVLMFIGLLQRDTRFIWPMVFILPITDFVYILMIVTTDPIAREVWTCLGIAVYDLVFVGLTVFFLKEIEKENAERDSF